MNSLQASDERRVRRRRLHPAGADDLLEHADHGVRRHARLPRLRARRVPLPARDSSQTKSWFLWAGVLTIPLPYLAALAGWVLSEVGRQPWIVWGLLKTVDANSPSVSTATIATSLGTFVVLYIALLIVDFVLMRRYARVDPPEVGGEGDEFALPTVTY